MTTTAPVIGAQEILEGLKVVDADTHYTEPHDLWTSRAPAGLKERMPRFERKDGEGHWIVDQDIVLSGGAAGSVIRADGEKVMGELGALTLEQVHRAGYDPRARLQMMDLMGIYAQIVYPNVAGFGSARFMTIPDEDLRRTCVSVYNDAIAEFQQESGNRMFPQFLVPFWDLKALENEVTRATQELKLTGMTLSSDPQQFGLPDYSESHWDPLWELCNDLKLPINFHIASAELEKSVFMNAPWSKLGPQRRMAVGSANQYMDNARMVTNLLFSGLFDRYPNLKFVSVESGIGWVPFVLEACEYQFDEMVPTDRENLTRRPTEYFKDHIYACFWFERSSPRWAIEMIGPNNILFETDYPHPTCIYPGVKEQVVAAFKDIDPQARRRILQDNAIELYKLPISVN